MNIKSLKFIKYVYYIFAIGFVVMILTMLYLNNKKVDDKLVNNGIFIATNINQKNSYSLVGDWQCYQNKLYDYETLEDPKFEKNFGYVSKYGSLLNGQYVTYAIDIQNSGNEQMTVYFPTFSGGYKIFLDQYFVGGRQNITDPNGQYRNKEVYIAVPPGAEHKLIVQMARDDFFMMGFLNAPKIASSVVYKEQQMNNIYIKVIIGIITVIFSTFLIIFNISEKKKFKSGFAIIYLIFSVLFIYINILIITLIQSKYTTVSYFYILKTTYICSSLASLFVLYYFALSGVARKYTTKLLYFASALTALYIVFVIFSGKNHSELVDKTCFYLFLAILGCCAYSIQIGFKRYDISALYNLAILIILVISFCYSIKNIKNSYFYINMFTGYIITFIVVMSKEVRENQIISVKYVDLEKNLQHQSNIKTKRLVSANDILRKEIDARKEAEENLIEITIKDFLTGLYNRMYANKYLTELMKSFEDENRPFTVVMLDIDNFKYCNDAYGHDVGDEVLKMVAQTMMRTIKASDIVARWGGEEFLVILQNTTLLSGVYVAEKIRKEISSKKIEPVGKVTVSLGVAEIKVGENYEIVVARADENLFLAKRNGKNCTFPI